MTKLYYSTLVFLVLGLASGLFYREFTKANHFTDGFTQLSVVHTHLLALGVVVLLIVLLLEKAFTLSHSKAFNWFFWVYTVGLVVTAGTMTVNGMMQVLGEQPSKALAGISGTGHILLTIGFVLLFIALGTRIRSTRAAEAGRTQNA